MTASPRDIMDAWNSVTDEWIVRRNKAHRVNQWEVVHDWGGDVVSEKTMKVISRHKTFESAEYRAAWMKDYARGAAVVEMLERLE